MTIGAAQAQLEVSNVFEAAAPIESPSNSSGDGRPVRRPQRPVVIGDCTFNGTAIDLTPASRG